MSPSPSSPINRLIHPAKTSSQDINHAIRKRVCKACNRCRLKKSKCDGSSPCSRCKADNAICAFGERKKPRDKVYPKGYVEVLEQQQTQLVSGLKEMYYRLQKASAWYGATLDESSGRPLTHDILSALDLQKSEHDDSVELEAFEESCKRHQSRMVLEDASFIYRRQSLSSDLDHGPHERPTTPSSCHDTRSKLDLQPHTTQLSVRPSTLQSPKFNSDPQLYTSEWAQAFANMSEPDQPHRNNYAMQTGNIDAFGFWDPSQIHIDSYRHFPSYQSQMGSGDIFSTNGLSDISDLGKTDAMEFNFSEFV